MLLVTNDRFWQYTVLCTLVGALAIFVSKIYSVLSSPLSRLPGPTISKWTGLRLKYAMLKGQRVKYIHDLHERYGPIVRVAPREVSVVDVDAARKIYKIGSQFLKTTWYEDFVGDTKNKGLFSMVDPKVHSKHRAHMSWFYTEKSIADMEDTIAYNVQLAIKRMRDDVETNGFTDIWKWFFMMVGGGLYIIYLCPTVDDHQATDVIGDAAFGESFKMLESGKENQYLRDLQLVGSYGIFRAEFPLLTRWLSYLPFALQRDIRESRERMIDYAVDSVQRYYELYQADPDKVKPTLLSKEFKMAEKGTLEFAQLYRDGMSNLIAGTDTTSNTLTYTVWLLSLHPDIEEELIKEVAGLPPNFRDSDLKSLKLLHGVIYETLRLRPTIGQSLPRQVPAGGAEFCGQYLPQGTVVGIQAYTMHRLPSAWHEPNKYDPTRWYNPTKDMTHAFRPFGGGSRICLGMHFAELEIRHTIANFYRTFTTGVKPSRALGFSEAEMEQTSWFLQSPQGERCLVERRAK